MENIINTFYKGNINKFGFGGWNTTKNNISEIIGSYPYPSNWNRQIDRYFQKSNADPQGKATNVHQNYIPSELTKSLPSDQRVDFSKTNAIELKPLSIDQYKNFDNHGFMNTQAKPVQQTNFSPALIRMEFLENKVREIEEKNRAEMIKNLNDVNRNIDPRFKKFLDNNQIGRYDIFGNDTDPLMERRQYIQNNLGNMRSKLDVEERRERKRKKKKEKNNKLKKKAKKNFFDDSQESEEEEQNEQKSGFFANENDQENANNLTHKSGTQNASPNITQGSRRGGGNLKSMLTTLKETHKSTNNNKSATHKSSKKGTTHHKTIKISDKSVSDTKDSKEKKHKETTVCGNIGYSFTPKTNKERELQFQTNRLGKDFDKLLNEIRDFKRVIKDKINVNNDDENNRLNIYKDIFLLDNKAKMKHAVDRIINRTNESFDSVNYQKKIDKEKENEINDIINKKINDYNYYMDRAIYAKKINDERKQMLDNNLINKHEYRRYRERLNNQVVSLPNIYLRPTYNMTSNRQKTIESKKETNSVKEGETIKRTPIVIDIVGEEETIRDFGTSIDGNDQFRTKEVRDFTERSETVKRFVEEKSSDLYSKNKKDDKNLKNDKNKISTFAKVNNNNINITNNKNNNTIKEVNENKENDKDEIKDENGKEKLKKKIKEKEKKEKEKEKKEKERKKKKKKKEEEEDEIEYKTVEIEEEEEEIEEIEEEEEEEDEK